MSTDTTLPLGNEGLKKRHVLVFEKTKLIRCVSRVIWCYIQFLGLDEVPPLMKQYRATVYEMYYKYGYDDDDVEPDEVLSSFVLSFLRHDLDDRFKVVLMSLGSKANNDVPYLSFVDLHTTASKKLEYPFYGFSVCLYKSHTAEADDGVSVIGLCDDEVFFDSNDGSESGVVRFNVGDIPAELGVKLPELLCSSVFILEMDRCDCGCHDFIASHVNKEKH